MWTGRRPAVADVYSKPHHLATGELERNINEYRHEEGSINTVRLQLGYMWTSAIGARW